MPALLVLIAAGFAGYVLMTAQKPPAKANIFFFKNSFFLPVERTIPQKSDPLYFVAEELLRGPSGLEIKNGYFSEIPEGTKLRQIYKKGDTVIADFSKELASYGGGAARVQGLLAQVVFTLTDVSGASKVQIMVEGRTEAALGGEGYIIDKPLTRKDTGF